VNFNYKGIRSPGTSAVSCSRFPRTRPQLGADIPRARSLTGQGGTDLLRSSKENKSWGQPSRRTNIQVRPKLSGFKARGLVGHCRSRQGNGQSAPEPTSGPRAWTANIPGPWEGVRQGVVRDLCRFLWARRLGFKINGGCYLTGHGVPLEGVLLARVRTPGRGARGLVPMTTTTGRLQRPRGTSVFHHQGQQPVCD